MYATVHGIALRGLEGFVIGVEADLQNGLPNFELVGLPASSVREARERVRSALVNSGYEWPRKRIVVSLAPADWRKDGTGLDLPIAVAVLIASEQIPMVGDGTILLGELALDGSLHSFRGLWTAARKALSSGADTVLAPQDSEFDSVPEDPRIVGVSSVSAAVRFLRSGDRPPAPPRPVQPLRADGALAKGPDLSEIAGQRQAKRALEIAAAGGHHLLFTGPPGGGKSLLAASLARLLPELSEDEWTEVRQVYSIAGLNAPPERSRPFRTPHHTITPQGLLGGGGQPRPGEVSLAHLGVLFLDEFPEFSRATLEGLRQPLETGEITVSRAAYSCTFPGRFQLIAAMNPCPCGHLGSSTGTCTCETGTIQRYRAKLSGPLLDRIDLSLWIEPVPVPELLAASLQPTEPSGTVRQRVEAARAFRALRTDHGFAVDTGRPQQWLNSYKMDGKAWNLLIHSGERFRLSVRGLRKIAQVARTAADLELSEFIQEGHVAEALLFRTYP